jgi:hypothetical protein
MSEKQSQPAWGWLLLIPVLGAAFVLYIQRLHVSPVMFDVLGLVGLVLFGVCVEVWFSANKNALLHFTEADGSALALYAEREAVAAKPAPRHIAHTPGRRLVPRREYVAPLTGAAVAAPVGELLE